MGPEETEPGPETTTVTEEVDVIRPVVDGEATAGPQEVVEEVQSQPVGAPQTTRPEVPVVVLTLHTPAHPP